MRLCHFLKIIIDPKVYSSLQQFRIVGSQKNGSNRPKIFNRQWQYHNQPINYQYCEPPEGDGHKMMMILGASLVSNISCCKFLPKFIDEEEMKRAEEKKLQSSKYKENDINITKEIIKQSLVMLAGKAGMNFRDRKFPYTYSSVENGLIILKRERASKCQICDRIHEHENPFLIVKNNGELFFNCRRSDKSLYIGNVNINPDDQDSNTIQNTTLNSGLSNNQDYREISSQNIKYGVNPPFIPEKDRQDPDHLTMIRKKIDELAGSTLQDLKPPSSKENKKEYSRKDITDLSIYDPSW